MIAVFGDGFGVFYLGSIQIGPKIFCLQEFLDIVLILMTFIFERIFYIMHKKNFANGAVISGGIMIFALSLYSYLLFQGTEWLFKTAIVCTSIIGLLVIGEKYLFNRKTVLLIKGYILAWLYFFSLGINQVIYGRILWKMNLTKMFLKKTML